MNAMKNLLFYFGCESTTELNNNPQFTAILVDICNKRQEKFHGWFPLFDVGGFAIVTDSSVVYFNWEGGDAGPYFAYKEQMLLR
jgi:hypothetical protein